MHNGDEGIQAVPGDIDGGGTVIADAAPTRQPHRLAGDGVVAFLACGLGEASVLVRAGWKNAELRP